MGMASSSSIDAAADISSPLKEKYDVFLSFRGGDTRKTFTSHLHAALKRDKFETYIDGRLERGDKIGPALLEAIEKSKISVVILSKNYASSTWCLDKLAHILRCKESFGQIVIPIFYGIDPSDIRKQQGSYADAFAQLEERFKDSMDKVLKWRDALNKAANLSGFSNETGTEADLVKSVVQVISTKLNTESSSDLNGLVGMDSRIKKIESLLCINDSEGVCTVGIWGMGGIGKTTLADAVFHRLYSEFEASYFLANVREESEKYGLTHLRNVLLREILKDTDLNVNTPSLGPNLVRMLRRLKVLIVLDDVNEPRQVEILVGESLAGDHAWFAPGSRIIITTRDRRLLKEKVDDCKIYQFEKLNCPEALHLFHLHAFKNSSPRTDSTELTRMVVDYAAGIPLALRVLGSLFLQCESKEDWEDELNKLKKFPNKKIQNVLRLSYDGLEENEQGIFLDIACFFKGMEIDFAKRILDIRGFFTTGIKTLIDMSLISISEWKNCLEMHDMIQEMGQTIVREENREPGKCSRLFATEDTCHVLKRSTGTKAIECIFFNMSKIRELSLNGEAFKKMYNLKVLKISDSIDRESDCNPLSLSESLRYLCWERCAFQSIKIFPENLVELHFPWSRVKQISWDDKGQNLVNLKVLNLRSCKHLTEVPNLSHSRKIESINLSYCTSLVRIPSYFQSLDKLTHLDMTYCSNLKYLSEMPSNIESLDLSNTAIEELPSSIWSHTKLSFLDIRVCKHLKNLPNGSCKLKLSGSFSMLCPSLCTISELPRGITKLELESALIEELPSSIECVIGLTEIRLTNCSRLVSLPTNICKLKFLHTLTVFKCSRFQYFPEILEPMEHLRDLWLDKTAVKELPSSIGNLIGLQMLSLNGCGDLESIPASMKEASKLSRLYLNNCTSLQALPELPLALNFLEAQSCTLLKTVSSSRTALTQCLDEYKFFGWLREQLVFYNCLNLDKNAWSNIMADAQLRIMRMATAFSNFVEDSNYRQHPGQVVIVCLGNEIPNWFSHQNEGSSITIKLPPNWFRTDFLGFALSLVFAFDTYNFVKAGVLTFRCESSFKTSNGESHKFTSCSYRIWIRPILRGSLDKELVDRNLDSDHVPVCYDTLTTSADFYNAITELSLDVKSKFFWSDPSKVPIVKWKKCGVHLLYAQDFEKLKCHHIGDAENWR